MAIQEGSTHKYSLIGMWSMLNALQFPCTHPQLAVYFCISDAEGEYNAELQLVKMGFEEDTIGKFPIKVQARDRLGISEIVMVMKGLSFPEPAKYAFRLMMEGKLVGEKPFWVRKIDSLPGMSPPPLNED